LLDAVEPFFVHVDHHWVMIDDKTQGALDASHVRNTLPPLDACHIGVGCALRAAARMTDKQPALPGGI
jgi:hypothetical protein